MRLFLALLALTLSLPLAPAATAPATCISTLDAPCGIPCPPAGTVTLRLLAPGTARLVCRDGADVSVFVLSCLAPCSQDVPVRVGGAGTFTASSAGTAETV